MGRKYAKKRKHLFLYFACFLMVLFRSYGCISSPKQNINFPASVEADRSLIQVKALMDKKDFSTALKQAAEVLSQFPKTHGDLALYQMGLIYAHPQNPQMDYTKSLECFQMVMQSSGFEKNEKKNEIISMNAFLETMINRKNKDSKISKLQSKVTMLEEKTGTLEKQKNALQEEVLDLKDQLKRLKEIDIGIEEKKREALPK